MSVFEIVLVSIVLALTLCAMIVTIILWIDAEGFTKPEYNIFYNTPEVKEYIHKLENPNDEEILWKKKK